MKYILMVIALIALIIISPLVGLSMIFRREE